MLVALAEAVPCAYHKGVLSDPLEPRPSPEPPPVLITLDPIYEQPGPAQVSRRRRRGHHHRRRSSLPLVRMRFSWWHLGVALLLCALGGWLVLAIQPWHVSKAPPVVNTN